MQGKRSLVHIQVSSQEVLATVFGSQRMQGMERTVLFRLHFLHVSSCFCLMGARVCRTHPTQGNSSVCSEQALPPHPSTHSSERIWVWKTCGRKTLRGRQYRLSLFLHSLETGLRCLPGLVEEDSVGQVDWPHRPRSHKFNTVHVFLDNQSSTHPPLSHCRYESLIQQRAK